MRSEASDRDTGVAQISVGGLEDFVTAKTLSDYLEEQIGMVWRCQLKTSSTPRESYPIFEADPELEKGNNDYVKVEPHAYVHFALPRSAKKAFDAAGRGELVLGDKQLKAYPFFCVQYVEGITLKVLFLLNAVIHKGVINQHQLSESLFDHLRSQPEELNLVALKHMCSYKRPVYDAHKVLQSMQKWLLNKPKLLERREMADVVEVHRLIITPSRAYCLPPEVELSNRVLRQYRHVADRFLRVTFMDEAMQTLNKGALTYYLGPIATNITSNYGPQKTAVFERVKDILTNGFYLCGRRYTFLAFSANQLRDRSAWFFAQDRSTTTAQIKKSLQNKLFLATNIRDQPVFRR